ncbi:MAG: TrbC/VirB2 family protein [Arcobacteraceae bacterium]|nr:TrbC/VirB2 family protein [Arcobacteraceae bacterium]
MKININKEKKMRIFKISTLLLILVSSAFGSELADNINKIWEFLDDGVVQAVAGVLIATAGFTLAFGNVDKAKVYLWGIVIGISLVYSARGVAAIFS